MHRHSFRKLSKGGCGALALAILLSACTVDPKTLTRVPRPPSEDQEQSKSDATEGANKSAKQDSEDGDSPETLTESSEGDFGDGEDRPDGDAPEDEGAEKVAALDIDLTNLKERLIGFEADEISELMGPPDFERSEPPAKIWQYRTQTCVVDMYLYDEDGDVSVDHIEVRGRGEAKVEDKACFASILQEASTEEEDSEEEEEENADGEPDQDAPDQDGPDQAGLEGGGPDGPPSDAPEPPEGGSDDGPELAEPEPEGTEPPDGPDGAPSEATASPDSPDEEEPPAIEEQPAASSSAPDAAPEEPAAEPDPDGAKALVFDRSKDPDIFGDIK